MLGLNDEEQKAFVEALRESELIADLAEWEPPKDTSWRKLQEHFMIG